MQDYGSSSSPVADTPHTPDTQCQPMSYNYFGNAVLDTTNVQFQCLVFAVSQAGRRLFVLACLHVIA